MRCWEPRDAPLLKEAVDSSLDHLRPWMPWAHDEPQPRRGEGRPAARLSRALRPRPGLRLRNLLLPTSRRSSAARACTRALVRGRAPRSATGSARAERARVSGTEATAAVARVGFEVRRRRANRDPGRPRRTRPRSRSRASSALSRKGRCGAFLHGPDGTPLQLRRGRVRAPTGGLAGSPVASAELRAYDAAGEPIR